MAEGARLKTIDEQIKAMETKLQEEVKNLSAQISELKAEINRNQADTQLKLDQQFKALMAAILQSETDSNISETSGTKVDTINLQTPITPIPSISQPIPSTTTSLTVKVADGEKMCSDFNMGGMEKLIYVHALKLGESLLKEPRAKEATYKDSTNIWYVIKRGSNDSVEISPVFEDIKSFNHPDPALGLTECQVIGSRIFEIGGWKLSSLPSLKDSAAPGSKKIRCLDTRNPKEGWRTCFTLPFPACYVRSTVVGDQWLYFFGGLKPKGSSYPWGYALNVDDFSKVKEISEPGSGGWCWPAVSSLSPDTVVAYIEGEDAVYQLDCTNNTWSTLHLKDFPRSPPGNISSTIYDGILYIIDLQRMCFITYDIRNGKELPRAVLPRSFLWSYHCFINLVVLAKNKFCSVWNDGGEKVNNMTVYYLRFSVSYDVSKPTVVIEETQHFSNIEGVRILNAVAM